MTINHKLEFNYEGISKDDFFGQESGGISILSGTNNCGKSLVLKLLFAHFGEESFLCGTNRYYDMTVFPQYNSDKNYVRQMWQAANKNIDHALHNMEPVVMPFQEIFTRLKDDPEREDLYQIASDLLGEPVVLEYESPGNSLSNSFLTINGTPLAKCSSGSRMLVHLLSILLYRGFRYVLIDEPELGLTPRIQNDLQHLIYDEPNRKRYMSHLQHVYIATHSHIFLNRRRVSDNYLVTRENKEVIVKRLTSDPEFMNLQFRQLGNSFEQLQLPSGFVIVEGESDYRYMDRLFRLNLKNHRIHIVQANNDSQVSTKVHLLFDVIGPLQTSPYRDRVFVILDETHTPTLRSKLESMGLKSDNIIIWEKNGIEFYYPISILRVLFNDEEMKHSDLVINEDVVSHNDINKKKMELCTEVLKRINGEEELEFELEVALKKFKILD